jgi:hypothetical protein
VNAPTRGPALPTRSVDLVAELDAARAKLDRKTDLLQWSIDLRELLYSGLDLDDMTAEVAAFRRACNNKNN